MAAERTALRVRISPSEAQRMILRVLKENGRDYLGTYGLAIGSLLLVSATTAFSAWIMKDVIDTIFYEQRKEMIALICGVILIAFIVRGIATYAQAVLLARIGNNLVARYQRRIFDHLMRLGLDFFNDVRSGHLAAQINQNVNGVRDLLNVTLTSIARDFVSLVALVVVMIVQDPVLSGIALLIGPPLIFGVAYVSRRIRAVTREAVTLNSRLLGAMQETTQGISIVKAFTMEDQLRARIGQLIEAAEERSNKISRVQERTTPLAETLAGFAIAAVIAYGGYRALVGHQPPGSMFAFITALMLAYDPARRLARLQVGLERMLVNAHMIYEILDLEPRQRDVPNAAEIRVGAAEIRIENAVFGYRPLQPVLHGISFTAEAGKTTAIVGASGSGKSTLIALLQRFYDLEDGRITIDGQDIALVTKESLRRAIAYVSQQPYLFEGTIADNIRYGRPDATEEDVRQAAKLANAHEFILAQPQGYDTPIGENGVTLSGGQRQRISIARAIVRNAPILLLDEATSALDNESEKRVQQALDRIMKGRTTVVVAHRLSTIVSADRIVVFEEGRLVEEGNHASLMARPNGVYARFHALQGRDGFAILDDLGGAPAAGEAEGLEPAESMRAARAGGLG